MQPARGGGVSVRYLFHPPALVLGTQATPAEYWRAAGERDGESCRASRQLELRRRDLTGFQGEAPGEHRGGCLSSWCLWGKKKKKNKQTRNLDKVGGAGGV